MDELPMAFFAGALLHIPCSIQTPDEFIPRHPERNAKPKRWIIVNPTMG